MKTKETQIQKQEQALPTNSLTNLRELIKADSKKRSVEELLQSPCPSIALAKKELGEQAVKTEIMAHMVSFIDYIGVKNNFTLNHVETLVSDIMDKYYSIKVSEVAFILKEARQGAYGEMFNNVNPIKIMTWFDAYFDNRLQLAEAKSINQWSAQKANEIKESARPLFTDGQRLGNISKAIEQNMLSK